MLGLPYEKPAAYTRDYLEVLNAALAGPGDVDIENERSPSTIRLCWARIRRCPCWSPRWDR